jgi:hypothetical protein
VAAKGRAGEESERAVHRRAVALEQPNAFRKKTPKDRSKENKNKKSSSSSSDNHRGKEKGRGDGERRGREGRGGKGRVRARSRGERRAIRQNSGRGHTNRHKTWIQKTNEKKKEKSKHAATKGRQIHGRDKRVKNPSKTHKHTPRERQKKKRKSEGKNGTKMFGYRHDKKMP